MAMLALGSALYMVALAARPGRHRPARPRARRARLGDRHGRVRRSSRGWPATTSSSAVEIGLVASSARRAGGVRRRAASTACRPACNPTHDSMIEAVTDMPLETLTSRRLLRAGLLRSMSQVVGDHHLTSVGEVDLRLPAELGRGPSWRRRSAGRPRPGGRTSGPGARSCCQSSMPTSANASCDELLDVWVSPGGDDVVVGLVLLQHQPHRLHVVAGVAPVALGVEVAEHELVLQAELDPRHRVGDLAGDELEPAARALVVEQDARCRRTGRSSRGS